MKTMLLAAAAVLAIGVGSAYAGDGAGDTVVGAEWAVQNGQSDATSAYAGDFGPATERHVREVAVGQNANSGANTTFTQDNAIPNGEG